MAADQVRASEADCWRGAVGPNADRYLTIFARMSGKSGWMPGWNTAAFFHSTGWFCYRRMYGWAFLNLFGLPLLMYAVLGVSSLLAPQQYLYLAFISPIVVYGVIVFLLVPVFADSLYFRSLRRRLATAGDRSDPIAVRGPSQGTRLGALAFGVIWFLAVAAVSALSSAYDDRAHRAKLWEAVLAASALRAEISEFYEQQKRLPTQQEAAAFRFRADESVSRRVKSIVYDSAAQRIVITLREPHPDKQLALHAEVRDGTLAWRCRSIDVEEKYLPVDCRK